jgi:TP901 family phage tail tape measure protein
MADDFVVELRVDLNAANLNAELSRALGQANNQFTGFDGKVQKTQKSLDGAAKSSQNLALGMSNARYALYDVSTTLSAVSFALGGVAIGTTAVAIAWERDFANVARTSGLVGDELAAMRGELVDLAQTLPSSFGDITKIATLGAQLGVAADDLTTFTDTVIKFSAATGISAEESAQAFGRLGNILGVTSDQYDNLGSSIVKAGVSAVATESEIVAVAQQIGPIARLAGSSADEVIGLATAFASVKIPPELARSVVTKTFGDIERAIAGGGEKLEKFGAALGMSGREFADAWRSDATSTFVEFLDAIPTEGSAAIAMLDGLGLSSQRNTPALQKLAQNVDLVKRSLRESGQGFSENTELNRQYNIIAETTAARLQVLANNFMAFLDAVGSANLGPLGDLLDFLSDILRTLTDFASTDIGGGILGTLTILVGFGGVMAAAAAGLALFGASTIAMQQGLAAIVQVAPRASAALLGASTAAGIADGTLKGAALSARLLSAALKTLALATVVLALPDLATWYTDSLRSIHGVETGFEESFERIKGINMGAIKNISAEMLAFGRGLGDVMSPLYGDIKRVDEAMAQMAKSGNVDEARKRYFELRNEFKESGMSAAQFKALFIDTTNALKEARTDTGGADAFDALNTAMSEAEDQAAATQAALDALREAILTFGQSGISAEQAQINLSAALNGMAEAAAVAEASLSGTNAESLALRQSYIDVDQAAREAAAAMIDNGSSADEATAAYMAQRQAIIDSRVAKGEDAAAAAAWADSVLGNAAEAEGAIRAYADEVNAIPPAKDTTLKNNADAAGQTVSQYARNLERLERTYYSRVVTSYETIGDRPGIAPQLARAGGGPIYGPGTSTSDSILAALSNGEYVIKAAAVDKYGLNFISAINSMRLPKFASGGSVGGGSGGGGVMTGVMELGPKTMNGIARSLSVQVMNNLDDVAISRSAQRGDKIRRSTGEI